MMTIVIPIEVNIDVNCITDLFMEYIRNTIADELEVGTGSPIFNEAYNQIVAEVTKEMLKRVKDE